MRRVAELGSLCLRNTSASLETTAHAKGTGSHLDIRQFAKACSCDIKLSSISSITRKEIQSLLTSSPTFER